MVAPLLTLEPSDPLSLSCLDSALDGLLILRTGVLFNGVLRGDAESKGLLPGLASIGGRSVFGVTGKFFGVFLKIKRKVQKVDEKLVKDTTDRTTFFNPRSSISPVTLKMKILILCTQCSINFLEF